MATKIKVGLLHEQVVLGSMLRSREVRKRLVKSMQPSDFLAPRHQALFAALHEMDDRRLDYVPATLKSFMPPGDEWGGVAYLDSLVDMSTEENLEHHQDRAKWDKARSLILNDNLSEFEAALKDPRLEVEEARRLSIKMLAMLDTASDRSAIVYGSAMVAKYMANLYSRESGSHLCSSGYRAIDKKLTNPFGRGLLSVISAAPSIGKTTFSLNMALRQSANWRVGYLAWESGTVAATDIICASALGIKLETLIKSPQQLSRRDRDLIEKYLDELFSVEGGLSFLEPPPKSLTDSSTGPWEVNERMLDWIDGQLSVWRPDIFYWDLFEKKLPDRRPQAISWALDRVQEMAHNHAVHIALLHQVTFKELEKKVDKRPSRGLLKGSGGYIETPDVVFGLYRRAVYEPGIADDELEIYCLKQRIGPWPWRVICDWDGKHCNITGGREAQITVIEDEDDEAI
jgi:replicative DNA helicase